jgi:hypothetical protein
MLLTTNNLYSIVPKLKSNFHDVFAELEKEMAEDPGRKIAFADAADNPVMIGDVVKGQANPLQEVVPNIIYGQNSGQANLLKGIDNKTTRTLGFKRLHPFFYPCSLLSNTLFIR